MSILARQEFVVGFAPEQVFDFLSDMRNELKWNPDLCQAVEKVSDGPIGVGTTYRAKWKGSPEIEAEYVEYDRPRSWRARAPGSLETRFWCNVEPHAEGAKVVSELELIPHGFFKLVFPIFKMFFGEADQDVPDKIRRALHEHYAAEATAPHGAGC